MYYSGIGDRGLTTEQSAMLTSTAQYLSKWGTLRTESSGGSFARGTTKKEVYHPSLSPSKDAREMAQYFDSKWMGRNEYQKDLLACNAYILLGMSLDKPSDFLLYYREDKVVGHALRIAREFGVKTYNLYSLKPQKLQMFLGG